MFIDLFKNTNNRLNRKISSTFLLCWIFGALFALIGFVSVFFDLIFGFFLLLIPVLLLTPIPGFIEKKIKIGLTEKIKAIILILCLITFGTVAHIESRTSETAVKNTASKSGDDLAAVSVVQKIEGGANREQTIPESEKAETNPAPAQTRNNNQTIQPPEEQIKYYTVTKIVDGDTIDVNINGVAERLRLIGIDTPEVVDPRKPVECFGREASKKASELLLNQRVKLEPDQTQNDRDKYGRLLRYIYKEDGLFYNKWIIENGYAHEYTYVIPYKYRAEFQQAENYARENKLGLWSPDACGNEKRDITAKNPSDTTETYAEASDDQAEPIARENSEVNGHIFYTSRYFTSKLYYCDTDPAWKNLSEKYLESYPTEDELLKKFPTKTLHEPCK